MPAAADCFFSTLAAGFVDGGDDQVFEHRDVTGAAEAAAGAMVSLSSSFLPLMRAVTTRRLSWLRRGLGERSSICSLHLVAPGRACLHLAEIGEVHSGFLYRWRAV